MFKFGKPKSAAPVCVPEAQPSPTAPSSDAHEALAIGAGTTKALAEAVDTARGKLQGFDPVQLRAAAKQSADGARSAGPRQGPPAAPSRETTSMINNETPSGANGNGTAPNDGKPQGAAKGGTVFTEPTPGGKQKTVAQLFGEIVWLFSQSPKHKNFFVSDLEWLVMTPILLKQFRVFYAPDRPIGVALWAYVTDEVEQRLMTGQARLAPADWKGGEKLWLVDIVAPFGGHDAMIADLKEKVFAGTEIVFLGISEGQKSIRRM